MSAPDHHNLRHSAAGPTRLRQLALVAHDLKRAEYLLTKVIGTEVLFVDPGVAVWGLENVIGDPGHLQFTNARMRFLPGMEGKSEGFTDVSIAVRGEERHKGIFDRAREVGLPSGDGWVEMLGCRWHFVSASGTREDVNDGPDVVHSPQFCTQGCCQDTCPGSSGKPMDFLAQSPHSSS
ncbi:hypothetical protein BDBG_06758 [Blastomyces gilchristii SLH14081]|uniref:Glyoxalase-like domain-containing protein n=1 Tax=Blastomyces gilchristii (strain SLH14081) TaxID=559298 RepID=A0A179UUU9_BLAGS|nr:uncharacterized protein BDBG_06758 [Blastomyces gilchristii SLH14081]OAT10999.1 hypothetical protein BDBG_06758 [Blastomyces gilchristii SLH14081]